MLIEPKMEPYSLEEMKAIAAGAKLPWARRVILTWAHERAGRLQRSSVCNIPDHGHHVLTFEERLSGVLAEIGWQMNPEFKVQDRTRVDVENALATANEAAMTFNSAMSEINERLSRLETKFGGWHRRVIRFLKIWLRQI